MSSNIPSWRGEAPANLALIKYMGKSDAQSNRPSNASLSFTMDHLLTMVEISPIDQSADQWKPLLGDEFETLKLSEKGQDRYLRFFADLKSLWGIQGSFMIRSGNTFPSDCGLASSASSFAALTRAAHRVACDLGKKKDEISGLTQNDLSQLSRRGSGSSCRSFFTPWALWRDEGAEEFKSPVGHLLHQVAVIHASEKEVSSSEAHRKVESSKLYQGRAARAEHRLQQLVEMMNQQNWRGMFELVWSDFWDMHALFETSDPSFGYMTSSSFKVLDFAREIWRTQDDGPLVTMDAGPNVHLLYRQDQKKLARWVGEELRSFAQVIESPELHRESES